ncbi:hypothetical protein [Candidatus Regiella endosymbiont of Tuberolachnus salignus]|uniref:hypothetical protein n=1 Tax=Candidatus Regiella endosymbiont of Tuberolachnus salignus TaxID=3077956 RepID=UPI0030CFDEC2
MKTIKTLLKILPILLLSTTTSASHEKTISNICQELWKSGNIPSFPSKICLREESAVNTDNAFSQSKYETYIRERFIPAPNFTPWVG